MKTIFRLLAKALGEKASTCDKEADQVAWFRILIVSQAIITNLVIIAGVIRHWN